jgi:SAM-dependent methyltransferase
MALIGREQRFHPDYTAAERGYIALLGVPVVGLRIRARNILRLLPAGFDPSQVLDAGSGPGVISVLLARRYPAATVTGVDTSAKRIEDCRSIARAAKLTNTEFQVADASDLPWMDRFDLITCVDILEHIEDDERALTSLHRALAPGGKLVLHVPAKYRRYPVFRRKINFPVPTHVRPGYLPDEILEKVAKVGFEIEEHGYTYGFLETLANNIGYMITKAERRNKAVYALAFPVLNLSAWLGRGARPKNLGAGVYVIAGRSPGHAEKEAS